MPAEARSEATIFSLPSVWQWWSFRPKAKDSQDPLPTLQIRNLVHSQTTKNGCQPHLHSCHGKREHVQGLGVEALYLLIALAKGQRAQAKSAQETGRSGRCLPCPGLPVCHSGATGLQPLFSSESLEVESRTQGFISFPVGCSGAHLSFQH